MERTATAVAFRAERAPATPVDGPFWRFPSAWASFAAAFLTAFTVTVVGEMPVGEIVFAGAAAWAALCVAVRRAWPGPLVGSPHFRSLLGTQGIALIAYIASDLYRRSLPRDMARGWSRMVFLAIDFTAVAYLLGCRPRNLLVLVAGEFLGDLAHVAASGAMFGDLWKFGVGTPATYLLVYAAPFAGPFAAMIAAWGGACANFLLDYRSLGGICAAVGAVIPLPFAPRRIRGWLAPVAVAAAAGAVAWLYSAANAGSERATRSDIERSAMIQAAWDAFVRSPLIGNGSWFSNTDVYDNFLIIRHSLARQAHVGGFSDANTDPGDVTLHSQLLVALAEGGLFGGSFFLAYGAGLLWAIHDLIFVRPWRPLAPLLTLILVSALWDLLFSPFSGAHRVGIAEACGLVLLLERERSRRGPRRLSLS